MTVPIFKAKHILFLRTGLGNGMHSLSSLHNPGKYLGVFRFWYVSVNVKCKWKQSNINLLLLLFIAIAQNFANYKTDIIAASKECLQPRCRAQPLRASVWKKIHNWTPFAQEHALLTPEHNEEHNHKLLAYSLYSHTCKTQLSSFHP